MFIVVVDNIKVEYIIWALFILWIKGLEDLALKSVEVEKYIFWFGEDFFSEFDTFLV